MRLFPQKVVSKPMVVSLQQNVFSMTKKFITKTPSLKVLAMKNFVTESPICLKKKKNFDENISSLKTLFSDENILSQKTL